MLFRDNKLHSPPKKKQFKNLFIKKQITWFLKVLQYWWTYLLFQGQCFHLVQAFLTNEQEQVAVGNSAVVKCELEDLRAKLPVHASSIWKERIYCCWDMKMQLQRAVKSMFEHILCVEEQSPPLKENAF